MANNLKEIIKREIKKGNIRCKCSMGLKDENEWIKERGSIPVVYYCKHKDTDFCTQACSIYNPKLKPAICYW